MGVFFSSLVSIEFQSKMQKKEKEKVKKSFVDIRKIQFKIWGAFGFM